MKFTQRVKGLFWGGTGETFIQRLKSGGMGTEAIDFLSANEVSLYLNRAIHKRAEKVGEIKFVLKDVKGNDIENDPLLDLLNNPNELMTGAQFWALFQTYKDLTGSAYIWIEPSKGGSLQRPAALHLLRPDWVKPVIKDAQVEKYIYKKNGGTEIILSPEEVIRDYYPDPLNPFFGVPLIKAGALTIDTEIQLSRYHAKVLRNGGKVEGVFKFTNANEEQIRKAKQSYQENYAGSDKAGIPLFLGGEADYKRVGLTPEELSYISTKKMVLEDICVLTGVPAPLLAAVQDVKYSNFEEAHTAFLRDTVRPLLGSLAMILDLRLFPDNRTLTYVDPTPENIDYIIKKIKSGDESCYMTTNEKRELAGLEPIKGGDTILVPFNRIPQTDNTEKQVTKGFKHPLSNEQFRRKYWKMKNKTRNGLEKAFQTKMVELFKDQEKRLVDYISGVKQFRRKDLLGAAFDKTLEIKITKVAAVEMLREIIMTGGNESIALVGSKYDFVFTSTLDKWIYSRAELFAEEITETTARTLAEQFTESLQLGESRPELVSRIQNTYQGFVETRAKTIARTEVHGAYQKGTLAGYEQAGVEHKIWVAVVDASSRDWHAAIDGEKQPIHQPFSIGLMFPGDGGPEESANCRCSI